MSDNTTGNPASSRKAERRPMVLYVPPGRQSGCDGGGHGRGRGGGRGDGQSIERMAVNPTFYGVNPQNGAGGQRDAAGWTNSLASSSGSGGGGRGRAGRGRSQGPGRTSGKGSMRAGDYRNDSQSRSNLWKQRVGQVTKVTTGESSSGVMARTEGRGGSAPPTNGRPRDDIWQCSNCPAKCHATKKKCTRCKTRRFPQSDSSKPPETGRLEGSKATVPASFVTGNVVRDGGDTGVVQGGESISGAQAQAVAGTTSPIQHGSHSVVAASEQTGSPRAAASSAESPLDGHKPGVGGTNKEVASARDDVVDCPTQVGSTGAVGPPEQRESHQVPCSDTQSAEGGKHGVMDSPGQVGLSETVPDLHESVVNESGPNVGVDTVVGYSEERTTAQPVPSKLNSAVGSPGQRGSDKAPHSDTQSVEDGEHDVVGSLGQAGLSGTVPDLHASLVKGGRPTPASVNSGVCDLPDDAMGQCIEAVASGAVASPGQGGPEPVISSDIESAKDSGSSGVAGGGLGVTSEQRKILVPLLSAPAVCGNGGSAKTTSGVVLHVAVATARQAQAVAANTVIGTPEVAHTGTETTTAGTLAISGRAPSGANGGDDASPPVAVVLNIPADVAPQSAAIAANLSAPIAPQPEALGPDAEHPREGVNVAVGDEVPVDGHVAVEENVVAVRAPQPEAHFGGRLGRWIAAGLRNVGIIGAPQVAVAGAGGRQRPMIAMIVQAMVVMVLVCIFDSALRSCSASPCRASTLSEGDPLFRPGDCLEGDGFWLPWLFGLGGGPTISMTAGGGVTMRDPLRFEKYTVFADVPTDERGGGLLCGAEKFARKIAGMEEAAYGAKVTAGAKLVVGSGLFCIEHTTPAPPNSVIKRLGLGQGGKARVRFSRGNWELLDADGKIVWTAPRDATERDGKGKGKVEVSTSKNGKEKTDKKKTALKDEVGSKHDGIKRSSKNKRGKSKVDPAPAEGDADGSSTGLFGWRSFRKANAVKDDRA